MVGMKNKTTGMVVIALIIMCILLYFSSLQKKFGTVDFTSKYKLMAPIELAGFEQGEGWQGNFTYDNGKVQEGNTSIIFSSWYGKENTISRQKQFTIEGYKKGYLSVFIKNKEQLNAITSFLLVLKNENAQEKTFVFSKLATGWNRIEISLPDWKKITSLTLSINSKPEQITEINLDRLWLEKNDEYKEDLDTQSKASSLRSIGERVYYFSASNEEVNYSFNQIQPFKKGVVSVSVIPEHANKLSLALNGTVAHLSIANPHECILTNDKNVSVKKKLTKTSFENNIYVFIKATALSSKIKFSLSNNGVDFEDCGEIETEGKTSTKLFLDGSYLIDSYSFEY